MEPTAVRAGSAGGLSSADPGRTFSRFRFARLFALPLEQVGIHVDAWLDIDAGWRM